MEQNDAIAEVDCKRMPKCCENPRWVKQFGSNEGCRCLSCGKKCRDCQSGYLDKR